MTNFDIKKRVNDIRYKTKKVPLGVKASTAFVICSIFQKGIQLITVPIFTRLLSTDQYGQFTLYQSWLNIVTVFATLNLSAGVFNNGMLKYPSNREEYTSTMQGLSTLVTAVVFLIYLLFNNFITTYSTLPDIIWYLIFCELFFSPALAFWSARQRFEFKYKMLVLVTIIIAVLQPITGLFLVRFSEERGIARIASVAGINTLIGLFFYIKNYVKGQKVVNGEYWRFALKFNLPLIPHYLSNMILSQSDRIMIAFYYSSSEAAIYGLAYQVALLMNIVTNAISASFTPWIYQKINESKYTEIMKITTLLFVLMFFLCLFPSLVAPEIIMILGGNVYVEGIYLIPPISASVFFVFSYVIIATVQFYFEKSVFIAISTSVAAILNLALNAICIPIFGYQAAAYTTLVCYVIYAFVHYSFSLKIARDNHITHALFNKKIFFSLSLLTVVFSLLIQITYSINWLRYMIIAGIFIFLLLRKNKVIGFLKSILKTKY